LTDQTDQNVAPAALVGGTETKVAAVGTVASLTALFSTAACCVLPLALAGIGIGAGGLATFVPYRWPLTIAAAVVVGTGWVLHLRKRRACAANADCAVSAPSTTTFALLSTATLLVAICAFWSFIEQPLMRALGGA